MITDLCLPHLRTRRSPTDETNPRDLLPPKRVDKDGELRVLLEPGVAGGRRVARCELAYLSGGAGGAGPERAVGYAVPVARAACPPGQLGAVGRIGKQASLGVPGEIEHPGGLVPVQHVQDAPLYLGIGKLGPHARWHAVCAKRSSVGVPHGDRGVQLALGLPCPVRPAQAHRGQQQRLVR
jgi:hypothetical protein